MTARFSQGTPQHDEVHGAAVAKLSQAYQLIEDCAYELARDCPAPIISELILAAAEVDRISKRVSRFCASTN